VRKSAVRLVLESAVSREARSVALLAVDSGTSPAAWEGADVDSLDSAWVVRREAGGRVMDTAARGFVSAAGCWRLVWDVRVEF